LCNTRVHSRIARDAHAAAAKAQEDAEAAKAESLVLKAELTALREGRSGLEKESKSAKAELARVKKQAVIAEAASRHGFIDAKQISKLVGDEIVFDGGTNTFHIVAEDGNVRVGLDGSTPLTLDAFFQDFANRNSHLVRGTVKNGVGSSENARPYSPTTERDRLKAIFGKGSNAIAANRLGVENPQLYKQYKREARALGIIP
jgi:hypothetical protein